MIKLNKKQLELEKIERNKQFNIIMGSSEITDDNKDFIKAVFNIAWRKSKSFNLKEV